MKKHFVTFYSPGTFFDESTREEVETWDIACAVERAKSIRERHGAVPFGFRFSTFSRTDEELDSKVSDTSPMYYLGGLIETLEEVEVRNDPKEEILLSNMRSNGYKRIIINTNSWKVTKPLMDSDIVLDF